MVKYGRLDFYRFLVNGDMKHLPNLRIILWADKSKFDYMVQQITIKYIIDDKLISFIGGKDIQADR